jgi:hypothetical protein
MKETDNRVNISKKVIYLFSAPGPYYLCDKFFTGYMWTLQFYTFICCVSYFEN